MTVPSPLAERAARSADPHRAQASLERIAEHHPDRLAALAEDPAAAAALVAVTSASGWMGRLLVQDPAALEVLDALDDPPPMAAETGEELARWRRLEHLRIAAGDLTGRLPVEGVMAALTAAAAQLAERAATLAGAEHLAVIAMGKAGGNELNPSSDVDVVLVGPTGDEDDLAAARRMLDLLRPALRIDLALRPEGRDGPLVRTVHGYQSHWSERAEPWERQALLKARPLAGDAAVGRAFAAAAAAQLWERPFDAEAIRSVRAMKARTEALAQRAPDGRRDLKRTPGGIRDVEFAAQLLQLVHGPHDPSLRVRGSLPALTTLVAGGYISGDDGLWLAAAYRLLRRVEHAVQIDEDRQTHAVPADRAGRDRVARIIGLVDRPRASAADALDDELRACRSAVRAIHERLYFRPLLEAFARSDPSPPLAAEAAAARLAAFGFSDGERTRQAVVELTRGLSRTSRLMSQMLPLLLDWLSESPDPDRGLVALRRLVGEDPTRVTAAFRESPETARRVARLAGTSDALMSRLRHAPHLVATVGHPAALGDAVSRPWAPGAVSAASGLRRAVDEQTLLIAAHDVLDGPDVVEVGRSLALVARAAISAAVDLARPEVPFTVLAAGRLAGGELSHASDLDLLFIHGASDDAGRAEARRVAEAVTRALAGHGPTDRIYDIDLDLRPGGRRAPLARSGASLVTHLERWAEPWERVALSRLTPIAGDTALADDVLAAVGPALWRPLRDSDRRAIRRVKARQEVERIPAGEDPTFHLKLGPGALADVELTVALLLLERQIREPGVMAGIELLLTAGALTADEARDLAAAHRHCDRVRDRWTLVAGRPRDALPTGRELTVLARSLDTTAPELRDEYLRLTRRARRVVERRFYGASD